MTGDRALVMTGSGELCIRRVTPAADKTPLICLHPAPFDGRYFAAFAERFTDRELVAPDYPGYGDSQPLAEPPGIADYATALKDGLAEFLPDGPVHLLGFHTGCLIACELALIWSAVRELVLIDVPCFSGSEQQDKYAADFSADDPSTWAFGAAFSYPCEDRLPLVTNPVLLIATGSALHEPTHRAAQFIPRNMLEDCTAVTRPAFTNGGDRFAALINAFLTD